MWCKGNRRTTTHLERRILYLDGLYLDGCFPRQGASQIPERSVSRVSSYPKGNLHSKFGHAWPWGHWTGFWGTPYMIRDP